MATTNAKKQPRVPSHFHPFHRPPIFAQRPLTQAPPSRTLPSSDCTSSPRHPAGSIELCPPHWRLPLATNSVRSRVKDVISKRWSLRQARHTTPLSTPDNKARLHAMRMKESDDYITARAANPRTGVISPSIGSPSPHLPWTSDKPAEALKLKRDEQPASPTRDSRPRPALRRANEGRKVRAESLNTWHTDGKEWSREAGIGAAASPRETSVVVGAGLAKPTLMDDDFVIHMPSAREPQPYAYPGRTPEEIAALKHNKRKAQRLSGQQHNQPRVAVERVRQTHGQAPSSNAGLCMMSATGHKPPQLHAWPIHPPQHGHCLEERSMYAAIDGDLQRKACPGGGGVEFDAAATNFAPYHSPRTPAPSLPYDAKTQILLGNLPGEYGDVITTEISPTHGERVKESSIRTCNNSTTEGRHRSDSDASVFPHYKRESSREIDLSKLPRVHLVHPELASLPPCHRSRASASGEMRECSLGCQRAENSNECVIPRSTFANLAPYPRWSLFEGTCHSKAGAEQQSMDADTGEQRDVVDLLFSIVASIMTVLQAIQLPSFSLLQSMSAPNATPMQKVEALKALLPLVGQALAFLVGLTLIWRLGAAVMHVVEVLLWPFMATWKILRWLAAAT